MLHESLGPVRGSRKNSSFFCEDGAGPRRTLCRLYLLLTGGTQRVFSQTDVQDLLLHIFAYENANPDCQQALRPIKAAEGSLGDYTRECMRVGSEGYKAILLVAALSTRLKQNRLKGYNCGKLGHI